MTSSNDSSQPATAVAVALATGPGLFLTSPAFADGAVMPGKFTASSADTVSPPLEWTNVPAGVESFVLILHDLDEAVDGTIADVMHWMAFNIPGTARSLPEGVPATAQLADGTIQARNHNGEFGYLGPGAAAPGPLHHYAFELFALDTTLALNESTSRAEVLIGIDEHILGKSVLVGRFHL
jgi:Raf kinase inhibitor-like YbhB/YbcL family protein